MDHVSSHCRIGIPLLPLLCLALTNGTPAAGREFRPSHTVVRSGGLPYGSAMADFDGDHKLDIATQDQSRREGGTYVQRISVHFAKQSTSSFTARTKTAVRRVRASDVDGDSDRDIVLESDARKPLAVWINDGGGHFHEGDLEVYRFRITHEDSRSLVRPSPAPPTDASGENPDGGAVSLSVGLLPPELLTVRVSGSPVARKLPRNSAQHGSRGPPVLS